MAYSAKDIDDVLSGGASFSYSGVNRYNAKDIDDVLSGNASFSYNSVSRAPINTEKQSSSITSRSTANPHFYVKNQVVTNSDGTRRVGTAPTLTPQIQKQTVFKPQSSPTKTDPLWDDSAFYKNLRRGSYAIGGSPVVKEIQEEAASMTASPSELIALDRPLTQAEKIYAKQLIKDSKNKNLSDAISGKSVPYTEWTPEQIQNQQAIAALETQISPLAALTAGLYSAFGLEKANEFQRGLLQKALEESPQDSLANTLLTSSLSINDPIQKIQQEHPIAYGVGNFAGEGAKYAVLSEAVSKIPGVSKVVESGGNALSKATRGTISPELFTRLLSGRVSDLPGDIINAALETDSPEEFAKNLGINTAFGLGMDIGLESVGALWRAARNAWNVSIPDAEMRRIMADEFNSGNAVQETFEPQIRDIPVYPDIDNQTQIPEVELPTADTVKYAPAPGEELPTADVQTPNFQEVKFQNPQIGGYGPNTVGAAESGFSKKQKTSKVFSNTFQNSDMFTQAEKDVSVLLLDESDTNYDVISELQSLKEASQRLEIDFEGEVQELFKKNSFDGVDNDTAMGILEQYLKEARETGDYTKVRDWSKLIQQKGTESGQHIQSFAKYSRTPEGRIIQAQRAIKRSEEAAGKNVVDRIEQNVEKTLKVINNAEQAAEKEIRKLLPEELLARKIKRSVSYSDFQVPNPISDMVNELFRIAKESPLPQQQNITQNPIEFLRQAIQKQPQYVETWEKAKNILLEKYKNNSEVSEMLRNYFEKGIVPDYSQYTLEKSVRKAAEDVGVDIKKIYKESKGNQQEAFEKIREYLIQETGATNQEATYLSEQIRKKYTEILNDNIRQELERRFPEIKNKPRKKLEKPSIYQTVMELINMGAYGKEDVRNAMKKRENLPVLDDQDIKNILDFTNRANSFPEGSYDKRMWETRVEQIISDKLPVSKREIFRTLQRISLILNPKSLITRNPGGNIILGTAESVKDIPAWLIDIAVSKKTGKRTTSAPSLDVLKAQAGGFSKGLSEWVKDIKNNVDTSPSRGQYELPSKQIFRGDGMLPKTLDAIDRLERAALQLGDRPFYQAAYDGRIAELNRLGISGEEAALDARMFALDRVLQNDSALSKKASTIRRELGILGDLIIPFTQTPANIFDKMLDYSPVGLGKAIYQLGQVNKTGEFNQKLFVDRIARSLTGTGIAFLGYALANAGLLVGSLDKDKDARSAQYRKGMQPYALKIGNGYFPIDFAQPVGSILAASADAYQAGAEEKDFLTAVTAGAQSGINTIFDQSFLSGVFDLLSGYNPSLSIFNTMLGTTSQVTPSGLASIAKTIDPYQRETYDPNIYRQQMNKLAARIPMVSYLLPEKIDTDGNILMQSQGAGVVQRLLDNLILPERYTTIKNDPLNDELLRIREESGFTNQFLRTAPKEISYKDKNDDAKTITLSTNEYQQYQKELADTAVPEGNELINSEFYQLASDADKADFFQSLTEYANELAKQNILLSRGIDYELSSTNKKIQEAQAKGISPAEYLIYREQLKAFDNLEEKDLEGKTKSEIKREWLIEQDGISPEQKSLLDSSLIGNRKDPIDYTNEETYYTSQMTDSQRERFETKNLAEISAQEFLEVSNLIRQDGLKKFEKLELLRERGYTNQEAIQIYNMIYS